MILTSRQESILEDAFELLTIGIIQGYLDEDKKYEMEELYELNDMIHEN